MSDIARQAQQTAASWFSGMDGEVHVQAQALDSRLRLNRCRQALQGFKPAGASLAQLTTVGVHCPDNKPWTLYVQVKIEVRAEVWISTRALQRGQSFDESSAHRQIQSMDPKVYMEAAGVIGLHGLIARQYIPAGRVLTEGMLAKAVVIRRGDTVDILIINNDMEVRASGIALENGSPGNTIKVRNKSSKRVVSGTVEESGKVIVRI